MFDERPTSRVQWWIVLAVALTLRVGILLVPGIDWSASDTPGYDEPARSLARGDGYRDKEGRPTAERPPGYPLFLSVVYAVVSPRPWAVGLAQALLGTATVALLHRLVARRCARAALPAAWILAIDPVALGVVPYVLREALLLFLLTLLLVWLDASRDRPLWQGLGGGLLLAALLLTHQLYLLIGPFLIVAAIVTRQRVLPWGVALLVLALAFFGWKARNEANGFPGFVLTSYPVPAGELWLVSESTNEWLHDDPTTGYQELHFREIARLQKEHPGDIAAVKSELYARALANFRREPVAVVGRVLRINFWYWAEVPGSVRITLHPRLWWLRLGLIPFHWLRLFWAVVAVVTLARRRELHPFAFEVGAWAFLAIAPCVLLPLPRYLSPLTAVLDGFAAVGLALYWTHRRGASQTVPAHPTGASPVNGS